MKRLICLILIFCIFLSGCGILGERVIEPVTFYYIRENYQKDMEPVIASEIREASGHREDLTYLLALYSLGPSREDLRSPFPRRTTIVPTGGTGDHIVLTMSKNAQTIKDVDFTLASACIALTCMELTDAHQVTVVCGEKTITLQEDNMLLSGSITAAQEETQ